MADQHAIRTGAIVAVDRRQQLIGDEGQELVRAPGRLGPGGAAKAGGGFGRRHVARAVGVVDADDNHRWDPAIPREHFDRRGRVSEVTIPVLQYEHGISFVPALIG